jgi:hypothetical protein
LSLNNLAELNLGVVGELEEAERYARPPGRRPARRIPVAHERPS